jgi:hypothetical protein
MRWVRLAFASILAILLFGAQLYAMPIPWSSVSATKASALLGIITVYATLYLRGRCLPARHFVWPLLVVCAGLALAMLRVKWLALPMCNMVVGIGCGLFFASGLSLVESSLCLAACIGMFIAINTSGVVRAVAGAGSTVAAALLVRKRGAEARPHDDAGA